MVVVGLGVALLVGALAPPPTWSASGDDHAAVAGSSAASGSRLTGSAAYLTSFVRHPGWALRPSQTGSQAGAQGAQSGGSQSSPDSPAASASQGAHQVAEYQDGDGDGDDNTTPPATTSTVGTKDTSTTSTSTTTRPETSSTASTSSTTTTTRPRTTTSTSTSTTTTTSTAPTVLAGGLAPGASSLGVFAGSGNPQSVADFGSTLGRAPTYAMDFLDGTSWSTITAAGYPYDAWKGSGYSMIWGVDMLPDTYSPNADTSVSGGSCNGLAQGATGAFDHYFVTVAQNIVNAGFANSVIRLGWEFNGGWFPWAAGGCASAFTGYFDHIVTAMRSASGQHFAFEWNPTAGDFGIGALASYYPGDAYVDYVGLDVYDVAWQSYPGMPAEFFAMETEADGLNWLDAFSAQHGKPMTFPEWGLGWGTCSSSGQAVSGSSQVCGGDDGAFVSEMAGWIATHDVFEATFWDYGSSTVGGGSNPVTAAALRSSFG